MSLTSEADIQHIATYQTLKGWCSEHPRFSTKHVWKKAKVNFINLFGNGERR